MSDNVKRLVLPLVLSLAWAPCAFAQDDLPTNNNGNRVIPDRDAPPKPDFQLTPTLTLGARLDVLFEYEQNFDLDDEEDEDELVAEPELTLSFAYEPSETFEAFLNFELKREYALEEPEDDDRPARLELTEAYLFFSELGGDDIALQLGRQRFDDEREWLYDERLDGIRVYYEEIDDLELEFSVTRENLGDRDLFNAEGRERINNYIVYGRYELNDEVELAGYILSRDDKLEDNESPIFIGLQSHGEIFDDLDHWLELALVRGEDGINDIEGYGIDIGATYVFDAPLEPSLTLAYAFGSGDADPDDGEDGNFRQTGLQDNKDKWNGISSFEYYGAAFDPELSNLSITTVGIGILPTESSSLDFVYHTYRQDEATDEFRDVAIAADPNGDSRDIGSEIDLVAGWEIGSNFAVEVLLGYFMPGEAFDEDERDDAFYTELEFQYRF